MWEEKKHCHLTTNISSHGSDAKLVMANTRDIFNKLTIKCTILYVIFSTQLQWIMNEKHSHLTTTTFCCWSHPWYKISAKMKLFSWKLLTKLTQDSFGDLSTVSDYIWQKCTWFLFCFSCFAIYLVLKIKLKFVT